MAEKSKITPEMREKLREPFPAEAIKQHPTKTFLSTIKAIFVVERLNDVFGVGRWDFSTAVVKETADYILVSGTLVILDYDVRVPSQYGGHKTTGTNTEIADGYKSAVTDALSKCSSYLEIGIDIFKGLADKPKGTTTQKQSTGNGEISKAQWDFILNIGKEKDLTENEVIGLVKWCATKNNISPRHWQISKLMLPKESFQKVLDEYLDTLQSPEENK